DTWKAPLPTRSLRDGLTGQFPRPESPRFTRPLLWVVAMILIASLWLAVGTAQIGESRWSLLGALREWYYEAFLQGVEAAKAAGMGAKLRKSGPRVYVDGRRGPPLQYGPAATLKVQIPAGVYIVRLYRYTLRSTADRRTGWLEAGHVHDNVIEFQAGDAQV